MGTLILADRFREDVLERRYAGPQVPHLDTTGRSEREDLLRTAIARHEDPHDIFVGGVAVESGATQSVDERLEVGVVCLYPQLVDAPARLLQVGDRASRGHAALVEDDDVVA